MAKVEHTVNVNSVSSISSGTFFKGEITSLSDIRIDGDFEGMLYSKGRVVIGETANVKGDIICDNVDMWGHITGNLYVKDTLSLKKGSAVDGVLNIRRLFVELGSAFNGTCKMITEAEFDDMVGRMDINKSAAPAKKQEKVEAKK